MFKMVKVSPEHHAKLKQYARSKDRTMKRILEDVIDSLDTKETYAINNLNVRKTNCIKLKVDKEK